MRYIALLFTLGTLLFVTSLGSTATQGDTAKAQVRKPLLIVSTDGNSIAGPMAGSVYLLIVYSDNFALRRAQEGTQAVFAAQEAVIKLIGALSITGALQLEDSPRCSADTPLVTVSFFDPSAPFAHQTLTNSFSYDYLCLIGPVRPSTPPALVGVATAICEFTKVVFGKEDQCPQP